MTVSVATTEGGVVEVSDAFGREFNEPLVHQVVVAWLAGARAGTRAQKSLGGRRAPTGRASAASAARFGAAAAGPLRHRRKIIP